MPRLMKGNVFAKREHKVVYPATLEAKYDEVRCHVIVNPQNYDVTFLSYAEKPLANMQGFAAMWAHISKESGLYEFDTGFMVGGSFDKTYRWVRSTKGVPADLANEKTEFILFDLPEFRGPYTERAKFRASIQQLAESHGYAAVCEPPALEVHSTDDVMRVYGLFREGGLEGAMLKQHAHEYEHGKRTDGWLKVKPSEDADGVIVELIQAVSIHGVPLNRTGSVRLRMEDGSEACAHGIPHKLGEDMHANPAKYLGSWGEMVYMQRDRKGGYRHPVFKRIREDKQ